MAVLEAAVAAEVEASLPVAILPLADTLPEADIAELVSNWPVSRYKADKSHVKYAAKYFGPHRKTFISRSFSPCILLPGRREEAIPCGMSRMFFEMSMEKASPPIVLEISSPIFFINWHCFPVSGKHVGYTASFEDTSSNDATRQAMALLLIWENQ